MFKQLMIVMKKELRRVFTDRRLVVTSFILPMISIALIYSVMGIMIQKTSDDIDEHLTEVLGVNVPGPIVVLFDQNQSLRLTKGELIEEEVETLLLDGVFDYYLYFDENFEEEVADSSTSSSPLVIGRYSPKSDYAQEANVKVYELLEGYRNQVLANRLGGENQLKVYDFDASEIAIPQEERGIERSFADLIPMLISVFIFAGAMSIGIDSIAGEKERGTLATMLVTPVDRGVIIGGKMLSLGVVALCSTISSFLGVLLSIPFSAGFLSSGEGFTLSEFILGPYELFLFLVCMLGLVGVYVTIISVLSMIASSVKEAGAYITPAYMAVMVSAFMNMFGGSEAASVQYYIPIFNNLVNMKQILLGNANTLMVMIAFFTSMAFTVALILIARAMMHKEKVVFPS
ncbi:MULTISPECIES: ABC transporter permease [unclassified Fusibacter]|uniref:ABC transporter permease n=1 Tax=unclassified Fusibacter TaxID=2624464 RepID=UPI001013A40E|nr:MULTISPECIES: ABC transporter permease subunit [unclassified Fusibacter]MCK8059397.1 ABC transporter permease subunit [Fusibacter sp. A2]NPE21139.1 ABC transporter permease [Fusibacter sp. A1]RXV62408.1 ABC transporter permease [Fusibacter sp. A1]